MKPTVLAVLLLVSILAVTVHCEICGLNLAGCEEGQCCTGGLLNRHCQSLADNTNICEPPNRWNDYRTACPCKEGLSCSVIRRCQPE